jgi:hypothetical protein
LERLDAIISDDLESKFRIEVAKRLEEKKATFRKQGDAIYLWINRPAVEKLKSQATNPQLLPTEREDATKLLGETGDSAIDALLDIGNNCSLLASERTTARQVVSKILEKKKTLPIEPYHELSASG